MLSNTTSRRIEWGDCDPAGIVFNPNFYRFFDHATTLLYEAAGWPKPVMLETFGLAGCPLVDSHAQFRAPCAWGEDIEIHSAFVDVRRSSFDISHQLLRVGTLCVEARDTRVWTRRDDTGRIRSADIPPEVRAAFQGQGTNAG